HGDDAVIQDLFEAALSVGITDSEASATIDSARRTDRQQPEPFVTDPLRSVIANPQNENSHLSRHRDESDKRNVSHSESDSSVESGKAPGSNNDAEPNHDPLGSAFTATSLLAQEFPPLEYVVPGVITEGLGL